MQSAPHTPPRGPLGRQHPPRRGPGGFTLIEMLMVIVIISILAGLLVVVVGRAMGTGQEAKILTEINQLSLAMEEYKNDYGSYPPNPGTDFSLELEDSRKRRILRHFARAFPRTTFQNPDLLRDAIIAATAVPNAQPGVNLDGLNINDLDPAEALVFFLGGLPWRYLDENDNVTYELTGFAADPRNPFQNANVQPQRTRIFYEFDPRRFVDRDGDGWPEYIYDASTPFETPPFVYFDAPSYAMGAHYPHWLEDISVNASQSAVSQMVEQWGFARPYAGSVDGANNVQTWVAPQGFQIVAAGLDGFYSQVYKATSESGDPPNMRYLDTPPVFPAGRNFTEYDTDNLTNFAPKRLGDMLDE